MAAGGLPGSDFEVGNEETFDYLCSPCKNKNNISEAVKYCVDCYDFYCSGCVKFHDDIPALRRHKILDKGQFPGSLGSQPALPTERCREHGHKPVDMYCQEHDVVGCAICMMTDHGSCTNKTYVPDFVKKNITMVDTSSCRLKLTSLVDCLRQSEKDIAEEIEKFTANKNRLIQDVKKLREDIDRRLDKLEQNTITELENKFNSLMSEVEDGRKRLRNLRKEVYAILDNLHSTPDNLTQQFVSQKLVNRVTVNAKEKLSVITDSVKHTEIDVLPLPGVTSLLQQKELLVKIVETKMPIVGKSFCAKKSDREEGKLSISQARHISSPKSKDNQEQPLLVARTNTFEPESCVVGTSKHAKVLKMMKSREHKGKDSASDQSECCMQ